MHDVTQIKEIKKKFNLLWLVLRSFIKLTGFIVMQKNNIGVFYIDYFSKIIVKSVSNISLSINSE